MGLNGESLPREHCYNLRGLLEVKRAGNTDRVFFTAGSWGRTAQRAMEAAIRDNPEMVFGEIESWRGTDNVGLIQYFESPFWVTAAGLELHDNSELVQRLDSRDYGQRYIRAVDGHPRHVRPRDLASYELHLLKGESI